MTIYADSSFIVSPYVVGVHSPEARRRMASRPSVWLTPFNRTEFSHALYQQVFRTHISTDQAQLVWAAFEQDCARGIWIPVNLPDRTWENSINLAKRYGPTLGVRTLDSLHVACALELNAKKFWTFDERQARLAEAVGLDTTP